MQTKKLSNTYIAGIQFTTMFPAIINTIILIVAVITSILPLLLAITETISLRSRKVPKQKLRIESKSGVTIELDLHKQNDTKKLLQTMHVLLGKI
jgi:hypothetical protein